MLAKVQGGERKTTSSAQKNARERNRKKANSPKTHGSRRWGKKKIKRWLQNEEGKGKITYSDGAEGAHREKTNTPNHVGGERRTRGEEKWGTNPKVSFAKKRDISKREDGTDLAVRQKKQRGIHRTKPPQFSRGRGKRLTKSQQ